MYNQLAIDETVSVAFFWPPVLAVTVPPTYLLRNTRSDLGLTNLRLTDVNGDGQADIVSGENGLRAPSLDSNTSFAS